MKTTITSLLFFTFLLMPVQAKLPANTFEKPNTKTQKVEHPFFITSATDLIKTRAEGCLSGDCDNGFGVYQYDNGTYEGFFKNGRRQDFGVYTWEEFGHYLGEWNNDTMEGMGVYQMGSFLQFGYWKDGELNGEGITLDGEKEFEFGDYKNGELVSKFEFISNDILTGCINNDCINGPGMYIWENDVYFLGYFQNGKMKMGFLNFTNGDNYIGTFNNDNLFDGFGIYNYANGDVYCGSFSKGKFNGKGYFEYADQSLERLIGDWINGELQN